MSEQNIVKESLIEIFKRNGYTDHTRMTQRDFEYIGSEIAKKAGILISSTTIKRLSNGEFSRLPQIATLNAIANYLGFATWHQYKLSKDKTEVAVDNKTEVAADSNNDVAESNNNEALPLVGGKKRELSAQFKWGLLALPIFILCYFLFSYKKKNFSFEKAVFSYHKNTSNEIPNTVVFNYNVDDVTGDSFFIQQSWDKNRRVRVYKNKYTFTDIYYEPGYHIAKLIANDSIIKAVEINIPTDKWFFYAKDNSPKYIPEYIKTDGPIENGKLSLRKEDILKNKIDIDKEKEYTYCYFPSKLEVSSENFTFKTRIRTKELRNNFCPFIEIEIFCQRYYMILNSTNKGCASEAHLQFGEKVINGKECDLASIAFDVSQWTDIEFNVKNKQVVIKINGNQVFSTTYRKPTKLIAGLAFISNGLCEIDHVELVGSDGKVVYKNEFDGK